MKWALLLLLLPIVHAMDLPVQNIYDPYAHRNEPVTRYSYADLAQMMTETEFRQWNDLPKVCQDIEMIFAHAPEQCTPMPDLEFPRAVTARAYAGFEIMPPPPSAPFILVVDPVYPPWGPGDHPYW